MTERQDIALGALVASESNRGAFGSFVGWLVGMRVLGPLFARLGRLPNQFPGSARVTRFHAWFLRRSSGRVRRSWLFAAGQPVLSLTTTGRKSGLARSTAIACFKSGEDLAVAGMNLGVAREPAWALNLQANAKAEIELHGERIAVNARRARGDEAAALWRRWVDVQPSAVQYRELAGREIPIFVLTRRTDADQEDHR